MSLDSLFLPSSSGLMKAVRISSDHKISVIDTTVPAPLDDEVVVKPSCCGICGTDLHILRHGFIGTHYPVTPGHEFAGHVVAVGRNVRNLREGDFVESIRTSCAANAGGAGRDARTSAFT